MSTFSHPITKIKLDPTGQTLVVSRGSTLSFFNAQTGAQHVTSGAQHTATIRSLSFCPSGLFSLSSSDDKSVLVWAKSDLTWANVATIKSPKKITSAEFAHDMKTIVIADKLGDVLHLPITVSASQITHDQPPKVIVGHYTSISAMTLSANGQYVITGDKDEHIRVSHYPQGFDIESFCLGHTEFIAGLIVSKKYPDLLISGGGDGTVKLWNMKSGKLLDSIFVGDNKDKKSEDADTVIPFDIHEASQTVVVGVEEKPVAYIVAITENKLEIKETVALKAPAGSASFDNTGNIWVSYLPVNALHHQIAQDAATSASSSSDASSSSSSSSSSTSTSVSIPESKLALLVKEGDHYVEKTDSPVIEAINRLFTDTVEKQEYFSKLHEISRNFQFRKRFGDGEWALGNNYYANAGKWKSKKKDKKAKVETTEEKKETNAPVVPNFV